MPLSDMDGLLPALRDAFGMRAWWAWPGTDTLVAMVGRFRIDPQQVDLGPHGPINATQTWFYVDERDIALTRKPGLHDYLIINDVMWEIVQLDYDDLGELGYRLIKAAKREPAFTDTGEDQSAGD